MWQFWFQQRRGELLQQSVRVALAGLCFLSVNASGKTFDARGQQFIAFKSFGAFQQSSGESSGVIVLTSPEIQSHIAWDELIVSWNLGMNPAAKLKVEVRAIYPDRATKWYTMGLWATDAAQQPRESVRGQKDEDGDVDTDTLVLKRPAERVQVRVTLRADGKKKPKLKFLSLSLSDRTATREPLPPHRAAWGKLLEVTERSQMAYPNGDVLCSPTTVSMLLSYWSGKLNRPGLDAGVPEVVKGVYDPVWGGTGNWVFNTAYAGSFQWMRAYTTRLTDVSELERFIARDIPVALSLCYNRLRGKSREPSGHLVVCVGFTRTGDVIINDPGTSKNVRKIFPRANLIDAWAYSKNAVYLVYPVNAQLPKDRAVAAKGSSFSLDHSVLPRSNANGRESRPQ